MIILRKHEPKILLPVPETEWRAPSRSQPKDQFGNENRTKFRIRGRLSDGQINWVGWFDDREEADEFLWAVVNGTLRQEPALWRLPVPNWHPDFGAELSYEFATVVFLTTTTGSNQTYTSPSNWNNSSNTIEVIGAGGGGGLGNGLGHGTGGGGGEYGKTTNFSFATPGTTTATYQLGTGGIAVTGGILSGNAGGDTWFNGTTQAGATLGAKGGLGGAAGTGSQSGGSGGSGGVGTTHKAGGRGGNMTGTTGNGASGGGGAGGSTAAGSQGVDSASTATNTQTGGGAGDGGSGGAGGAAGTNAGGNGTEWDASHGSGGGGGGGGAGGTNGGAGGNYGGGGGGSSTTTNTTGAGKQGIIVITYTPKLIYGFNQPMLGM